MRWSAAVLVGCAIVGLAVSPVQGAEVYRWIDGKGVAHYSQLPPSSQQQTFGRVNTAFTPAEQALIERAEQQELQKKLLQQATLPPSTAGAEQNCRNLQQDKQSYLKRRIDEQYLNSRNACDLSHVGVAANSQRETCYQAAKVQMKQQLAALPSVQLCRD